jgi:hypothetical protein
VFPDAEGMKERMRQQLMKKKYDVLDMYKETGCAQAVAKNSIFELVTLAIITLNTFWIAYDTDHNQSELLTDADIGFQLAENLFCAFFVFEISVRFAAFQYKQDCLSDVWFVFDSGLVLMMVLETWVLSLVTLVMPNKVSLGNMSVLRIVRLVRLTRMARLARLLRAVPELVILMKGMAAAARSVFFTLLLLLVLLYVFAIAFTQLLKTAEVGKQFFPSVAASMNTLWLYATLLEEVTVLSHTLQRESIWAVVLLDLFILAASLTVMNMLIGVLCEVVSAVATSEREAVSLNFVKLKILRVFSSLGLDGEHDCKITKEKFATIVENREAAKAIVDLGVDVIELLDMADFIFQSEDGSYERELSFAEFMDTLEQFRGHAQATVKDVMQLRKFIRTELYKERDVSLRRLATLSNRSTIHSALDSPKLTQTRSMRTTQCSGRSEPDSPRTVNTHHSEGRADPEIPCAVPDSTNAHRGTDMEVEEYDEQ